MANKKLKNRKHINIIYITLIVLVLLSNIFTGYLNSFLRLKPNISNSPYSQVHFIDVGQGDAIAIEFSNGKVMLVDSGTPSHQKKLIRYLDNILLKNKNTIDYLVLTHSDSDHISNMQYIVDNYQIGTFYRPPIYLLEENNNPIDESSSYSKLIHTIQNRNIPIVFNNKTNEIVNNDISIKWLYPDINDLYGYDEGSNNNLSAVILVEAHGHKMLLTGDIDSNIESSLINMYSKDVLDVDILKLAHHGSNYSTSSLLLETTSPSHAVASVGENSYGHPGSEMIDRILKYDDETNSNLFENFYTTLNKGNIIIDMHSLSVSFIDNIDNYSFVPYFAYSIIAIVIILFFLLMPYIVVWVEKQRKYKYNKKYRLEKNNLKSK